MERSGSPIFPGATDDHLEEVRRPSMRRAAAVGLARGFAGGLVATVAMSCAMFAAKKVGLMGELPPKKISDRALAVLGVRHKTPEPAKKLFATLNHFAFGGTCGALFGAAHGAWALGSPARSRAPVAAGLAFGTAIWAISYAGWVPALRIMPAPKDDRPGRPTSMLVAHWVFGALLAKSLS